MTNPNGKSNLPPIGKRQTRKLIDIEKRSAQILALFLLVSLGFPSRSIILGLILGGAVALLNFRWLWRIMEKYVSEGQRHYGVQAGLKFLTLLVGLFLIIRFADVHPVSFLLGLSAVVLGIFIEVIRGNFHFTKGVG